MKEKIKRILENILGGDVPVELSVPEEAAFGHYSTNLAMRLAKAKNKKPIELAVELAAEIKEKAPAGFFEEVKAAPPGFINFWISKKVILEDFGALVEDEHYGMNNELKGKTVMVEFTDPNPFKLFHIGHLMSNTIGESFARLYEASGAKVVRANYQGDVGVHVAKAVWGMQQLAQNDGQKMPDEKDSLAKKTAFMGDAYVLGANAYAEEPPAKAAIDAINEKIYARSDERLNKLYDMGRKWSLEYFETIYARLGTKFAHYFFESEINKEGLELVLSRKDIFPMSDGAIIFPGEQYGLHTRVFVNSKGLPTYEAKELGLNKKKFELYPLDLSIIVTGNEIVDYFKVLLKAMELTLPEVAKKTHHVSHGMLRLPSGKMSSRTGDVITAEGLLGQLKEKLKERASEKADLSPVEREAATECIAIGAIKYSILKQNPGQDIVFDFDKSLSIEGDSGPYLQYAYARLRSILRKAGIGEFGGNGYEKPRDIAALGSDIELTLIRKLFEFPDVVARSRQSYTTSTLATYLHQLAALANKFYETTPMILKDEDEKRRDARLALIEAAAKILRLGLDLLGIKTLEKI